MEMITRIAAGAIGSFLTAFFLFLLYREARKPMSGHLLAYGTLLKAVGFLGMVLFSVFGSLAWQQAGMDNFWPVLLFAFLALMSAALFLESLFVRVMYNERGIHTRSPWRPSRLVPWHAVTGYRYSANWQWHEVETRAMGRVRLSIYLRGLPEFFMYLEEKCGNSVDLAELPTGTGSEY
jgi:hypothetical protein